MDLSFGPENEAFREVARDFLQQTWAPRRRACGTARQRELLRDGAIAGLPSAGLPSP